MRLLQSKHDHRAGDVQKMKQGISTRKIHRSEVGPAYLGKRSRMWIETVHCNAAFFHESAWSLQSERSISEAADTYSRLLRNLVRSVSQEGTFD